MNIELSPLNSDSRTVWDDYVPIVQTGRQFDCYLNEAIEYPPSNYNQLVHLLNSAYSDDTIKLHLNTPGGSIDSAFMIVDAIKNSNAHVVAKLSGTVASAGTIITMACDEIELAQYLHFMVHNYSDGASGKGHEIKSYVNFSSKELRIAFREIYAGFLTKKEMDEIIDGRDLWLNTSEVQERWANREAYLIGPQHDAQST